MFHVLWKKALARPILTSFVGIVIGTTGAVTAANIQLVQTPEPPPAREQAPMPPAPQPERRDPPAPSRGPENRPAPPENPGAPREPGPGRNQPEPPVFNPRPENVPGQGDERRNDQGRFEMPRSSNPPGSPFGNERGPGSNSNNGRGEPNPPFFGEPGRREISPPNNSGPGFGSERREERRPSEEPRPNNFEPNREHQEYGSSNRNQDGREQENSEDQEARQAEDEERMKKEQEEMERRALEQMKRGVKQAQKGLIQHKKAFDKFKKQGLTVSEDCQTALDSAQKLYDSISNAKSFEDIEDIDPNDFRDHFETLDECRRNLERLAQVPKLLKRVDKEISRLEKDWNRVKKGAPEEASDTVKEGDAIMQDIKTARQNLQQIINSGDLEELEDVLNDSIFGRFDDLRSLFFRLEASKNAKRFLADYGRHLKEAERMIKLMKRRKEDTAELEALLQEAKIAYETAKRLKAGTDEFEDAIMELMDIGERFAELTKGTEDLSESLK